MFFDLNQHPGFVRSFFLLAGCRVDRGSNFNQALTIELDCLTQYEVQRHPIRPQWGGRSNALEMVDLLRSIF